jgi:hypothetical protein
VPSLEGEKVKYLATVIYDFFFIGGSIYLYGWKGWSGWWIVLGLLIASSTASWTRENK